MKKSKSPYPKLLPYLNNPMKEEHNNNRSILQMKGK